MGWKIKNEMLKKKKKKRECKMKIQKEIRNWKMREKQERIKKNM